MSEAETEIVFETVLDAPPEKIWRALTIPEYRDRWLAKPDSVEIEQIGPDADNLLTYRWTEGGSEESLVTIELTPNSDGTTGFRLTHAPVQIPVAANSNEAAPTLMRAA